MRRLDLSPATWRKLFWLSAVAAVVLSAWLSRYDQDLPTTDHRGIVALELAGSRARAESILCTWQQTSLGDEGDGAAAPGGDVAGTALDRAEASLRLDFLFLLVYPLAIGLGCCWTAGALERQGVVSRARGGRFLRGLGWAQIATSAFDLVEDLALVVVIARFRDGVPVGDALPALARWCALPKFALAFAGLTAVVAGLGVRALGKRRRPGPDPDRGADAASGRSAEAGAGG